VARRAPRRERPGTSMLDRLLQFVTGSPAFQFLRSVTPFDALPDADLERLSEALSIDYWPRGSTIFAQGQSAVKDLHVVLKGSLEIVDEAAGEGVRPRLAGVGETYGAACLLANDGVARFTVRALEDTFLYAVPAPLFHEACARSPEFHAFFAEALGLRDLERTAGARGRQRWLAAASGPDLVGFSRSVGDLCDRAVAWCGAADPIREAARQLASRRCRALLVRGADGALAGTVSERDLLERGLAAGLDPSRPVSEVMRPAGPLAPAELRLAEAVELMLASGARALPVAGEDGAVAGLLAEEDLLGAQSSPVEYLREIAATRLRKDLAEQRARLPRLVRSIMLEGSRIDSLTWLISAVSDATMRRVLDLALAELGPAPVPYAFLTLGSEGRREQTLVTDQDNALVWVDAPGREAEAADYFARLGERACTWLKEVGVEYCEANVMAANPLWCQPLSAWEDYFTRWVRVPEPEAVLHSSIFFDFREGYGDPSVAGALRDHVVELLAPRPGMFFNLLATSVVDKDLPVKMFGGIAVETKGDREDVFDIKQPIARICELARLHGLWHGVRATSTLERLQALGQQGALEARTCLDLKQAYGFLMQMRLARQVAALADGGRPADNLIGMGEISTLERRFLQETFALVARVMASTRRKFLRSM
jgi:CBS domain-containing protein